MTILGFLLLLSLIFDLMRLLVHFLILSNSESENRMRRVALLILLVVGLTSLLL